MFHSVCTSRVLAESASPGVVKVVVKCSGRRGRRQAGREYRVRSIPYLRYIGGTNMPTKVCTPYCTPSLPATWGGMMYVLRTLHHGRQLLRSTSPSRSCPSYRDGWLDMKYSVRKLAHQMVANVLYLESDRVDPLAFGPCSRSTDHGVAELTSRRHQ